MAESFVLKVVRAHMRSDARFFDDGNGLTGWAWTKGRRLAYVAMAPNGHPLCGSMTSRQGLRELGDLPGKIVVAGTGRLPLREVMDGQALPVAERCVDPSAHSFLARFAAALDEEAVLELVAKDIPLSGAAYAYVSGPKLDRSARVGICSRYPWSISIISESGLTAGQLRGVDAWEAISKTCVEFARNAGGDLDEAAVESMLRWISARHLPETLGMDMARVLRAIPHLKGVAPAGKIRKEVDGIAMLYIGHLAASYADAVGLPLRKALPGRHDSWSDALRALSRRAGMNESDELDEDWEEFEEIDETLDYTLESLSQDLIRNANDMIAAFSAQVVIPALAETGVMEEDIDAMGGMIAPDRLGGRPWRDGNQDGSVASLALRILARGKSLPGFLEEVASWHRNQGDIARTIVSVSGHVRWTEAFPPMMTKDGIMLTCIADSSTLAAEASAMRNCISSYLDECRSGACILVAARKGGRSIGTIEIQWAGGPVLGQVEGPRNAQPTPALREAAGKLVSDITNGHIVLADGALGEKDDVLPLTYVGRYKAMRDAWSRHLAKGVRRAPAAELIASAGPMLG